MRMDWLEMTQVYNQTKIHEYQMLQIPSLNLHLDVLIKLVFYMQILIVSLFA